MLVVTQTKHLCVLKVNNRLSQLFLSLEQKYVQRDACFFARLIREFFDL